MTNKTLLFLSLMLGCILGYSPVQAATVTIPTAKVGTFIDWNNATLTNCNVENSGANIGSTRSNSVATFTLDSPEEQDYVLMFKSGAKGLTAEVSWTISNAGGYSVTKNFSVSNTGNWSPSEQHQATFEAVPAGELTLTFKVESTTGSYAGNYGDLALHTMGQIYANPEETVPGGIDLTLGTYSNCRLESGGNVGYVVNGSTATYSFTVTKAGPYNFSWAINRYNASTVTVDILNYFTDEVELTKTFDVPELSNYATDIQELGTLTTGGKKMRLTFNNDGGYVCNFKNLALRYAGSDLAYYDFTLNVVGARKSLVTMSASPEAVDGRYEEGTLITLTAVDNPIMHFQHWADGSTATTKTYKMTADVEETATYDVLEGYVSGWDFSGAGNGIADYAERDENTGSSMYLITDKGEQTSQNAWFDTNNGYARIWANGEYDYVIKVDTRNYKDLQLLSSLTFGYNIWPTTKLQFSLDGQTWTDVEGASLTLTNDDRMKWKSLNATLPAEASHAPKLLLRWASVRPTTAEGDYDTSVLIGSASDYRALQIKDVYLLGTYEQYVDTQAPAVTYSTPAPGAVSAKSEGVIRLNFDRNVQLSAGAQATLGGQQISGTVFGSQVSFAYSGLDYNTDYTFTLSADAVTNESGLPMAADYTLSFKTVNRQTVSQKHGFDFVIGVDGTADEAIAAANAQSADRFFIFVPEGEWKLEGNNGHNQSRVSQTVSIIGQGMGTSVLYNDAEAEGISDTHTLQLQGQYSYLQDITVKNWRGHGDTQKGVAPALSEKGFNIYKNVEIWGNQDTYVSGGTNYWEGGRISGSVDYICGGGNIWFEGVDLRNTRNGSVITAPLHQASETGYVFNNCSVSSYYTDETTTPGLNSVCQEGGYNLGRPWQNAAASTYIGTTFNILPSSAGWAGMGGGLAFRFNEFGSMNKAGTLLDLSSRNVSGIDTSNPDCDLNPVLSADEVQAYTLDALMGEGYVPTTFTEQCQAPVVTLSSRTLSWADDAYALCYVIFRDGKYEANVTTSSYEATAAGTYTVRAANERGGLGDSSNAVEVTTTTVATTAIGWTTACVSYDAQVPAGAKAYYVSAVSDSEATLTELTAIPAGEGFILNATEGTYELSPLTSHLSPLDNNLLVGTTEPVLVSPSTVYVLAQVDDSTVGMRLYTGTTIAAGKAYLPAATEARQLRLRFDDGTTTAITEIENQKSVNCKYFDLQGRQLSNSKWSNSQLKKGVYITNGKKVIR